jgi:2-amino-4-hydroxy-6-hydroxymethyldihydropteridine diphosphokinase
MKEVYLLIGGNMGNREDFLSIARGQIEKTCGTITAISSLYETEAWGLRDQASFLNQAVKIETELLPDQLLQTILGIEEEIGRKREQKYGPRIIDIDIMFYGSEVISQPRLEVPHPQMASRRFALQCLAELDPGKMHPLLHKTIAQLLSECTDPLTVHKFY